ncbi:flavodoxin family protein [Collinsella aerofaciens]|uniref:flavodoxin family protein n=1 Tax=Collinsella aerofaciens TaxID=74426 RepID=UPI0019CFF151|nr:flavodoxin family protein [Collinsella aerofaciens]
MHIVVLSGSPRKGANTDTMVEAFAETAREGGNTVEVVRVASKKIAGCLGCQYCFAHGGVCVQKDDMANVIESLKDADMVVFASPIYWFDITAQEKAAIDRLYAFGATGFPFTKTALCSIATARASMMRRSLCTSQPARTASGRTRALSPSAV